MARLASPLRLVPVQGLIERLFLVATMIIMMMMSIAQVQGFPRNMSSYINIYMPATLHKNGTHGYPHRTSHFGTMPNEATHGSMSLNVYYYHTSATTNSSNTNTTTTSSNSNSDTNSQLCHYPPFQHQQQPYLLWQPPSSPFILMVNRGGCTYTTKARNAQRAGASGLLIADTQCLCADVTCMNTTTTISQVKPTNKDNENTGEETCQTTEPSMADDGSGGDVTIPTFLLRKSDADAMKQTITKERTPVLLTLRWHPPQYQQVNYSLWMDPLLPLPSDDNDDSNSDSNNDLLTEFKEIALALAVDQRAHFTPYFLLHNGTLSNCDAPGENVNAYKSCANVCTTNGRYCYPSFQIPGSVVVTETLRRLCIWKHYGADVENDGGEEAWWDYMSWFHKHCANQETSFSDKPCFNKAMKEAKIKVETIEDCMQDSGSLDDNVPNVLLDKLLMQQTEYNIRVAPTIWIHGYQKHEQHSALVLPSTTTQHWSTAQLQAQHILEAICKRFVQDGTSSSSSYLSIPPEVCTKCVGSVDPMACATKARSHPNNHYHKKKHHFWRVALFLVALVGISFGLWYYKKVILPADETNGSGTTRSGSYAMIGERV